MYIIFEHKEVLKVLRKAPIEIRKNYVAWKRIVEVEGPQGLRWIKGFHDEALKGDWLGFRSARLNRQWRAIYKVNKEQLTVYVVEVTPHQY